MIDWTSLLRLEKGFNLFFHVLRRNVDYGPKWIDSFFQILSDALGRRALMTISQILNRTDTEDRKGRCPEVTEQDEFQCSRRQ